jgi:hypothetical protein
MKGKVTMAAVKYPQIVITLDMSASSGELLKTASDAMTKAELNPEKFVLEASAGDWDNFIAVFDKYFNVTWTNTEADEDKPDDEDEDWEEELEEDEELEDEEDTDTEE